jgi:hypothetical protein
MKVVDFPAMEETDLQKAIGRALLDFVNQTVRLGIESSSKEDGRVPVQTETRFSGKT